MRMTSRKDGRVWVDGVLQTEEARDHMCYGVSRAELDLAVQHGRQVSRSGAVLTAMSMLSDAQEMIERGMAEQARQEINRAKYIMSTYTVDPEAK